MEQLNAKHAVVRESGKTLVINEEHDPVLDRPVITRSSFEDFRRFYENQTVTLGSTDRPKSVPLGTHWLRHPQRRQYEGMVFSPGKDVPARYYNLWKGFAVEPAPGDWSLMQAHLRDVIFRGNDAHYHWGLGYLAHIVQRSAERPEIALVVRGKQGAGKGIVAQNLGALLGRHFVHVSSPQHLTGHFNAHLRDAVFVFADEAFGTGDRQADAVLKMLITEAVIPIEGKGRDVVFVKNMVHLFMASNEDWVIPAGFDARRFGVFDVSDEHCKDRAYFQALSEQMERGGRAAMLHDLRRLNLLAIDIRQVPATAALRDQKLLSMKPVERWWFDKLMQGRLLPGHERWERVIPCSDLHEDYARVLGQAGVRDRRTETELGILLRRLLPTDGLRQRQRRIKGATLQGPHGPVTVDDGRPRVWELPDLEACRAHFDVLLQTAGSWPDVQCQGKPIIVTTFPKRRAEGGAK